jgi:hypothetical protein
MGCSMSDRYLCFYPVVPVWIGAAIDEPDARDKGTYSRLSREVPFERRAVAFHLRIYRDGEIQLKTNESQADAQLKRDTATSEHVGGVLGYLNAFYLLLSSRLIQERNFAELQPHEITVNEAFESWYDGEVLEASTGACGSQYIGGLEGAIHDRARPVISVEDVQFAATQLEGLASTSGLEVEVATLLRSITELKRRNPGSAIIFAWAVIERALNRSLCEFLDSINAEVDGIPRFNAARKRKLAQETDVAGYSEILEIVGRINTTTFRRVAKVRAQRNRAIHPGASQGVGLTGAREAILVAMELINARWNLGVCDDLEVPNANSLSDLQKRNGWPSTRI